MAPVAALGIVASVVLPASPAQAAQITAGPFRAHYNNPTVTDDQYFTGNLRTVLGGFSGNNTLNFPWSINETPDDVMPATDPDPHGRLAPSPTRRLSSGDLSFRPKEPG